jgi:hypothetical protein
MTDIIALARAYVRLIEAAQVIIGYSGLNKERDQLRQLVKDYQAALRQLLATVPADVSAQILAASEKVLGPVRDGGLN